MTKTWVARLGGISSLIVLAGGLVFLQVSNGGRQLVYSLPAYALIAVAALVAFAALRSASKPDLVATCATAIFAGYLVCRALTSPAPYFARPDLYSILASVVLYGLTITALSGPGRRMALLISLLCFAMVHVLIGLVQFGLGENFLIFPFLEKLEITTRGSGFYRNPDHLAGLLEILGIFGLSILCWSRLPRVSKVFLGYLTSLCYLGLIMTASRGGYLGAAASLVVFGSLSLVILRAGGNRLFRRFSLIGLTFFLVAVVATTFLIHQSASLSRRFGDIVTTDNTRLDLWGASIEQWKLQLLTGTGSGTYRFYGRQFRAERMQSDPVDVHNDYLHLLCEYGFLGILTFGAFFVAHLRFGLRSFWQLGPDRTGDEVLPHSNRLALLIGALSAIGAYVVHSALDYNLHIPANALLLAFVFGIVANPGIKTTTTRLIHRELIPRIVAAVLSVVLLIQCFRLLPGEYYAEAAHTALGNEQPAAAASLANRALANERNNPNIYFYLGRAEAAMENRARGVLPIGSAAHSYRAALAAFEEGRRLAPLDETYPLDIAHLYDQLGDFDDAEWMYGIARSLDPRSKNIRQMYKTHLEAWEKSQ